MTMAPIEGPNFKTTLTFSVFAVQELVNRGSWEEYLNISV